MVKKYILNILLFNIFSINVYAMSFKNSIELYGDIFQFLPAFVGVYSLAREDYIGLGYLAISTSGTLATTFAIKYSFVAISKKHQNSASISRRPNNGAYDGFPSGHTSSAFVAAGFAQKRYGSNVGVPISILATFVGASRVIAEKHTIAQVLAGAIIGYIFGYFITEKLEYNLSISLALDSNNFHNKNIYKLNFSYRF
ncbi:phosphatase PAP2 family protein [Helicobacter sp. MIT 14-3879]|uniref:phosphatase PAP2 family protein n=1 Tax=Helicobacter sp. MIT 14-3879 TaxID=2040649 RepID=UPI000E1F2957|nr:phosphatase PAP2 family protein [Helicobacter sp. MIT 14-3879]RDU65016.1 PAP2 family protein [Helicobacter sp. MIT 14-3879]